MERDWKDLENNHAVWNFPEKMPVPPIIYRLIREMGVPLKLNQKF